MDDRRRRFEALALPHLDAAYSLARWLTRSGGEADDIVQDAMLRAFRGFETVRGETVRPWLLAIVRNCWRDAAGDRSRRAHVPLPDDDKSPLAAPDPGPEEQAVSASRARALAAAVASLPPDFREVLILREIEDLSYRQIAEAVGAPIGTVMSRLARARAQLKVRWLEEDAHALR